MSNFFRITLFLIFACSITVPGQNNHLDKRINISIQNVSLGEMIYEIGETGRFQFSYNANILDGNKSVSVNARNERVRRILNNLLGSGYKYTIIGDHVIILRDKTKVPRAERKINHVISGYIVDQYTEESIYEASIYELAGRKISSTDEQGHYSLSFPASVEQRYLSFSKLGYVDTIVVVRPQEEQVFNVSLRPISNNVEAISKIESAPFDMHQTPFVAALVPAKSITMADNVQVIEERFAQISFLPFIGSNRFVSGMLTNRLSLNVFAGYSGGVRGLELGGFLNMDRGDMRGAQLSGFGNIVGKRTVGIQMAGFFNVTVKKMSGVQMAGFTNVAIDTIQGIQIAGFANVLSGGMQGIQAAGFANFTSKNVDGLQIAGFTNIAVKDVRVGQISGFANYARDVTGFQLAGFTNISTGTNKAVQISGFLNYSTDLHGLQISFINVSDTVSAGLPVGFFSFVRKGFHPLEISVDELFYFNLSFKTGINAFYNSFSAGANDEMAYLGYGIGSQVYLTPKFAIGLEANSRGLVARKNTFEFKGIQNQLKATFSYKFARHFSITTGPSINMILENENLQGLAGYPQSSDFLMPELMNIQTTTFRDNDMKYWFGWSLGIRL